LFDPRDKKKYPNDELFRVNPSIFHVVEHILTIPLLDYEKETLKVFWELSEEGKDTEHLFFRIPQTTYHWDNHLTENSPGPDTSEAFPSVRMGRHPLNPR
jgi:hypothetical protein